MTASTRDRFILAKLYRPSFRVRYGEEILELLERESGSTGSTWDLIRGAMRSWFTTGIYGSMPERLRQRDQRTVSGVWLAFFFVVVASVATRFGVYDPAVAGASEPMMSAGSDFGAVALVMVGLGGIVLVILICAASVRERNWDPIRAIIVGPALLVLAFATAIFLPAITGWTPGPEDPFALLLGGTISASFIVCAIASTVALRRARLSAKTLRIAAYFSLLVLVMTMISFTLTVVSISLGGQLAWSFAPTPLIVFAAAVLISITPGITKSALRIA